MKSISIHRIITGVLMLLAMTIMVPQQARAAGTAAGTDIGNTATVDYSVGGFAQSQLSTGPTATFRVDRKINLTVANADGGNIISVPSSTTSYLTFTVRNDGNGTQDFALTPANEGGDDFNTAAFAAYRESGATAGYQVSEDTVTYIDELISDATATVYVVATMPGAVTTGDLATMSLTATARIHGGAGLGGALTETAGANNLLGEDIVFADVAGSVDAAGDADHSALGTFEIQAAALTISKTAVVYSDPINDTTNPKAIPGAVITYEVTVTNAGGGAAATSVSINDALPGSVTFKSASAFNDGAPNCTASGANYGIVVQGTCYTNDVDAAIAGVAAQAVGNTVTVTIDTLPAGQNRVIKFQAIVN